MTTLEGRLSQPITSREDAVKQMQANGDILTPLAEKYLKPKKTWQRIWVEQPAGTNVCGQVAVAVIAGIPLADAIRIVGKKGCTKTKDLVKALRKLGFQCSWRCKKLDKAPPLAIGHLTDPKRKSGWHWVAIVDKKIYDGNGTPNGPLWEPTWKITSFLVIKDKMTPGQRKYFSERACNGTAF